VFDGHGVQLLCLIFVAGDFAMVRRGIHCSFRVVGAGRGVVVYFSLEKQLASLRHLFPAEK
jgi:hypothetical protein